MTIQFRVIHDPEEFEAIVDLETVIWSMPHSDAVPDNMLFAIVHSGGVVIRADDYGELVGFALGMVALRGKEAILWSHMAGVVPSRQGQGIGFALKQAQRRWALDNGFRVMAWTYDPLQRGNANFNLHLLKTVTNQYHVNFYGEMIDSINAGMPSDRLEITWVLNDERVTQAAGGLTLPLLADHYPETQFLLYSDADGAPMLAPERPLTEPFYFAEIPYHIGTLKRTDVHRARDWQQGLRQVMLNTLASGYRVVDFVSDNTRCWYVLGTSPNS
ncbi:MAG: GNAT family N-acetyltransferase [Anaerolineae bacterium]|nr:GNAT family N-acetyltransferase [Anaerolineae bacterium]